MRRKSLEGDVCAVARSLDVIGDWWSLLIIRDALSGIRRFSEFQRSLGAAKNILTSRLKALVEQGILELAPASDGSAYNEYVITAKGRGLMPALVALAQWGSEHLFDESEARNVPVDRKKGRPLEKLALRSSDGLALDVNDVAVVRSP